MAPETDVMPLELGMAMAKRFMDPAREHDWLVPVPQGHSHAKFVSDPSAYDPPAHDGSPAGIISTIVSWFVTRPQPMDAITPRQVVDVFPAFQRAKRELETEWHGLAPWPLPAVTARRIAEAM